MNQLLEKIRETYTAVFPKADPISMKEAYNLLHNIPYYIAKKGIDEEDDFEEYLTLAISTHKKTSKDILKEDRITTGKMFSDILKNEKHTPLTYARDNNLSSSLVSSFINGAPMNLTAVQDILYPLRLRMMMVTEEEFLERVYLNPDDIVPPEDNGPIPEPEEGLLAELGLTNPTTITLELLEDDFESLFSSLVESKDPEVEIKFSQVSGKQYNITLSKGSETTTLVGIPVLSETLTDLLTAIGLVDSDNGINVTERTEESVTSSLEQLFTNNDIQLEGIQMTEGGLSVSFKIKNSAGEYEFLNIPLILKEVELTLKEILGLSDPSTVTFTKNGDTLTTLVEQLVHDKDTEVNVVVEEGPEGVSATISKDDKSDTFTVLVESTRDYDELIDAVELASTLELYVGKTVSTSKESDVLDSLTNAFNEFGTIEILEPDVSKDLSSITFSMSNQAGTGKHTLVVNFLPSTLLEDLELPDKDEVDLVLIDHTIESVYTSRVEQIDPDVVVTLDSEEGNVATFTLSKDTKTSETTVTGKPSDDYVDLTTIKGMVSETVNVANNIYQASQEDIKNAIEPLFSVFVETALDIIVVEDSTATVKLTNTAGEVQLAISLEFESVTLAELLGLDDPTTVELVKLEDAFENLVKDLTDGNEFGIDVVVEPTEVGKYEITLTKDDVVETLEGVEINEANRAELVESIEIVSSVNSIHVDVLKEEATVENVTLAIEELFTTYSTIDVEDVTLAEDNEATGFNIKNDSGTSTHSDIPLEYNE